jgi:hypothetical protein
MLEPGDASTGEQYARFFLRSALHCINTYIV